MTTFQAIMSVLSPLLLIAILALAVWGLRKWQAQRLDEDNNLDWALKQAEAIFQPILFGLVTKAEREFGNGTGRLKLSNVVEQVISLLPNELKYFISAEWICDQVEAALTKAKVLWDENSALLESGIVLGSAETVASVEREE